MFGLYDDHLLIATHFACLLCIIKISNNNQLRGGFFKVLWTRQFFNFKLIRKVNAKSSKMAKKWSFLMLWKLEFLSKGVVTLQSSYNLEFLSLNVCPRGINPSQFHHMRHLSALQLHIIDTFLNFFIFYCSQILPIFIAYISVVTSRPQSVQ